MIFSAKAMLSFASGLVACGCLHSGMAIAQDSDNGHLAIQNPAIMTADEISGVYEELKERMRSGYLLSELPEIENYQDWKIYNSAPYLSATHGQRYINSYANELGKDYGHLPAGGAYPAGTVFAKDSITVTSERHTFPGALFVMQKLETGKSPDTADWRYVLVYPDGSLFGDTTGDQPQLVEYCHACHEGVADDDYVFYVPEDQRAASE